MLAPLLEQDCLLPDPFSAFADDHDDGVFPQPCHLMQLGPQAIEDLVGVSRHVTSCAGFSACLPFFA
jgi:hypothetical protein